MATRSDAVQAAREGARCTVLTVIESIAAATIEIGASAPVVAPLCAALLKAKDVVDAASRNKEELEYLHERCELIAVEVIYKAKASKTSTIDVEPLQECVDKLEEVAKRYHDRGRLGKLAWFRRDGDDIQRLRARIEALLPVMELSGVVNNGEKLDQILARLQPRPKKLASVPLGLPRAKAWQWHVRRHQVEDNVCEILGGNKPAVAALTGQSGAGKSTTAAAMVGERGIVCPRPGETDDQARTRLDRLRALFPDGVVWLGVGRGAGAADRLPRLMFKLAERLSEVIGCVGAPEIGEDGASYVKRIVEEYPKRCLVVADDVWENEVVETLRTTGMWVLLTTRPRPDSKVHVGVKETVIVDKLTKPEAEDILRGAAGLPRGEGLCDDAIKVLNICGRVAMDIAFVGSWTSVRATNGKTKSNEAWARAVKEIEAQGGRVDAERHVNRLAVLRAGFEYLAGEDPLVQKLYVMLAVFPDGHTFGISDAAVLLSEEDVAEDMVPILERWGVLKADPSEKYRMHDAHVDFARGELMGLIKIRNSAVERWTKHISRLDFAVGVDVYTLLRIWRALEKVGGKGMWMELEEEKEEGSKDMELRGPYDDQLVQMDISDQSKGLAVHVVAELYEHDGKFGELEPIMERVLEHCKSHGRESPVVQMAALYYTRNILGSQGRYQERNDVERRLGKLGGPSVKLPLPDDGAGLLQTSTTFSIYGVCMQAAGRPKDAEEWFRKALKAQKTGGLAGSYQNVWAMFELGRCVREAGRLGEAESLFRRALEIAEAKLGPGDVQVALLLQDLGRCVREAGRPGEAEPLFRRALEIAEATLDPGDVQVAFVLDGLSLCVREAGRPGDAEPLLRRALAIKEERLGVDSVGTAVSLHDVGLCVWQAGRPGEAEQLFRRSLKIMEAMLGPRDVEVAFMLRDVGLCVREAGRSGDAEPLFRRALEITEAELGPGNVQVAFLLQDLGQCVRKAGRPGEAEPLFRRALKIKEATLGADSVGLAYTLHDLGLCVRKAGRPGEAVQLFRRALKINEAKLGAVHPSVERTRFELGLCEREAGKPAETE